MMRPLLALSVALVTALSVAFTERSARANDGAAPASPSAPPGAPLAEPQAPAPTAETAELGSQAECVRAYESSQELKLDGKLTEARDRLFRCMQEDCRAFMRQACAEWLEDVQLGMPSVVFAVRRGPQDLSQVRVFKDGQLLRERLEGQAVEIDPGIYTFRFEADGSPPLEQRFVIREGERKRVLRVVLPAPQGPDLTQRDGGGPPPLATWILGGVGALGVAGFVTLGLWGSSDESSLRDRCAPDCSDADVDAVSTKYLLSDLSLGVGLLSLGAAGYFWWNAPSRDTAQSTRLGVGLRVTGDRSVAELGGTF